MLKASSVFIVLLFIVPLVLAEVSPISVEREITSTVSAGESVRVKLSMSFIGDKPNGIVITEYLPEGWEITSSLPAYTKFADKVSWLVYGNDVKDSTIVYELKAPQDFEDAALINGSWETISANGSISGDSIFNLTPEKKPAAPAQQPQSQAQDNTMLYIGGAILIIIIIAAVVVITKKKK